MPDIHTSVASQFNILVLMYHRIVEEAIDPWGLCVSPEHFEAQLEVIRHNFTVISLDQLLQRVQSKQFNKSEICITFDDGYADNFYNACPLLQQYNCPAAFFICTGLQQPALPFWWDELEEIFLHAAVLPELLLLQVGDGFHTYEIAEPVLTPALLNLHKGWRAYMPPPTNRCTLFLSLWQLLLPLAPGEIAGAVQALKNWAPAQRPTDPLRLPMSVSQMLRLTKQPLFTFGLHTHSHPQLAGKTRAVQSTEICRSRDSLLSTTGMRSNYLAYPYGSFDNCTLELVQALQLDGCFTTVPEPINEISGTTQLGRFQVFNWDAACFEEQLRDWSQQSVVTLPVNVTDK